MAVFNTHQELALPAWLTSLLRKAAAPARYIGGELGMIRKPWDSVELRFALCFPDLYEIGMSYHGREILYQQLNGDPRVLCERVFLPAHDMEELLREQGLPLFSIESKHPLAEFDAIGISFTYELAFVGGLKLLELAGVPLLSVDRREADPIIIGGGQCMCNAEPIAPFLDVAVNGEGEAALPAIVDCLISTKGQPRLERLKALAQLPGCYVPQFYAPTGSEQGCQVSVQPTEEGLPARVGRVYVEAFADTMPVTNPVQSYLDLPSDKAYLEVMRGCPQGCRFCQAGFITRPARARPVEMLAEAAAELARNTGSDEVSLMSLSTLDHPEVAELIKAVQGAVPAEVAVGLPSLRADSVGRELAELIRRPRESSLTLAIEAGSEGLRQAINKRLTEQGIISTFDHLLAAGWHKFKLYFISGLIGEGEAEMDAIVELLDKIFSMSREQGYRKPRFNLSVSVLVPKPHTPLQWQAMERTELTREKQRYLARQLKRFKGSVNYRYHDSRQSVIEALLSRGGRELAPVLEGAMRARQHFPSDYFDFDVWAGLLEEHGISLDEQVFTAREPDAPLPWDHIDRGVGKGFLKREWQACLDAEESPGCQEECTHCGLGCGAALFQAG